MSDKDHVTYKELDLILSPILEKQTDQIEATKDMTGAIGELTSEIRGLTGETRHLEKELANLKADYYNTKDGYSSTWEWAQKFRDHMFRWIIPMILTGIVASVAVSMGYVKADEVPQKQEQSK